LFLQKLSKSLQSLSSICIHIRNVIVLLPLGAGAAVLGSVVITVFAPGVPLRVIVVPGVTIDEGPVGAVGTVPVIGVVNLKVGEIPALLPGNIRTGGAAEVITLVGRDGGTFAVIGFGGFGFGGLGRTMLG
jgi:hypothetical protein